MTMYETPLDEAIEAALEDYRAASSEAQSAFDAYQDKSWASKAAWDKLVNLVRARHMLATGESIAPIEAKEIISAALNPPESNAEDDGSGQEEPEPGEGEPEPEGGEPEPEEGEEPLVEDPEPEPETDE